MSGRSRPACASPRRALLFALAALIALAGGPALAQTACRDADCEAAHRLIVMVDGLLGGGESIGAGIVVGHRANRLYVATAGHVVRSPNAPAPATDIRVTFSGLPGESFPAQLASDDASALGGLDLAVLIVPDVIGTVLDPNDLPFERLGDAAALAPGDIVRTLGQDRGLEWYTPVSPIRFARRERDTLVIESSVNRPGSSGGGLFSEDWRLVGMVVSSAQPEVRALSIDTVLEALGARNYPVVLAPAAAPVATEDRQEDANAGPAEAGPESPAETTGTPILADPEPTGPAAGTDETAPALIVRAGFDHALALAEDGAVWAWGDNELGQLGDGSFEDRAAPVRVADLPASVAVAAGYGHSLALAEDGTVWAWGDNEFGQLGDDTTTERGIPAPVAGLSNVVDIRAGDAFSLALDWDGAVWAWGTNVFGELGDGTTTDRAAPAPVVDLPPAVGIAAGPTHVLALVEDGAVWAWGDNEFGQLGDGTTTDRTAPVPVLDLEGVAVVDGGGGFSLAVQDDGTLWTWGANEAGQLGDGTSEAFRSRTDWVPIVGEVANAAAGYDFAFALLLDGTLLGWGANGSGELGDGSTTDRTAPVRVSGF